MAKVTIDESQFPSNSKIGKPDPDEPRQRERLKAAVDKGSVEIPNQKLGRRLAKEFLGDPREMREYFFEDVLFPGIKRAILDMMSMMFFNDTYGDRERGGRRRDYTRSFRSDSRRSSDRSRRDRDSRSGGDDKIDYKNIRFNKRSDADRIMATLRGRVREYGSASIADLYDLIDVTPSHRDFDFGWDREEDIGMRRMSDGRWLLDVPEAIEIY